MRAVASAAGVFAILCSGCGRAQIPYLGHWTGGFDVRSSSSTQPTDKLAMRGYLQLYRTDDKFLIEISNPIQVLDLSGTWRIVSKGRIELQTHDFKIAEPDIDKLKGMRRPYLDPEALRQAYARPLIFDLDPSGVHLNGLLTQVGPLLGVHNFRKGA